MTARKRRRRADDPPLGSEALTPAQLRVFVLASAGLLNKQIAFDLGIAETTVKTHMTAVMRKLNVHNRTQAAMAAHGLAPEGDAASD